jgi:hypothetical protein
MSETRQQHLIKCAEDCIGLMNLGVEPNAALLKAAKDGELNSNEVALVSHAVNNSKTLSVLANAAPEDKDKPFPLTNAEVVAGDLYSIKPSVDSPEPVTQKKEAAAASRVVGNYLAVGHGEDLSARLRAVMGAAAPEETFSKIALVLDTETLSARVEVTGKGRLLGTKNQKLAQLRDIIDEARVRLTSDTTAAAHALTKIAEDLRRTDAPAYVKVAEIAAGMGAGTEVLQLVASVSEQPIPVALAKCAGVQSVSPLTQHLVHQILYVEKTADAAASAQTVIGALEESYAKIAAEGVLTNLSTLPDQYTEYDVAKPVTLMQQANDSFSEQGDKPNTDEPLPNNVRQPVADAETKGMLDELMQDPVVAAHPVQDVIANFNQIRSVNPNMSGAEVAALVRHGLASQNQLPFDLLHKARATSIPGVTE